MFFLLSSDLKFVVLVIIHCFLHICSIKVYIKQFKLECVFIECNQSLSLPLSFIPNILLMFTIVTPDGFPNFVIYLFLLYEEERHNASWNEVREASGDLHFDRTILCKFPSAFFRADLRFPSVFFCVILIISSFLFSWFCCFARVLE